MPAGSALRVLVRQASRLPRLRISPPTSTLAAWTARPRGFATANMRIPKACAPQPLPPDLQRRKDLMHEHKTFTHGGNYWRDDYLLHKWDMLEQPVINPGQIVGPAGYVLIYRLGDWCWLTRHPETSQYLTVKFLPRNADGERELKAHRLVRERCSRNPYIAQMVDSFTIPHHLADRDPALAQIKFQAVVYEATGTDVRRTWEEDCLPETFSFAQRLQVIRDAVYGVAALHAQGIVHGDIHPGNLGLAMPEDSPVTVRFHCCGPNNPSPLQHDVIRTDGSPTSPLLPARVTEPISIGHGPGIAKTLDLGYSFSPNPDRPRSYKPNEFGNGLHRPPEFLHNQPATLPYKVDSWALGLMIYFIATGGADLIDKDPLDVNHFAWIKTCLDRLDRGQDFSFDGYVSPDDPDLKDWRDERGLEYYPQDFKANIRRIVLALMQMEPERRMDAVDLLKDEWLMQSYVTSAPHWETPHLLPLTS